MNILSKKINEWPVLRQLLAPSRGKMPVGQKGVVVFGLFFCMPAFAENVSLSTPHTSFVLDLDKGAEPQFLYYGPAIGKADIANLQKLKDDNWTRSDVYPAYGATHTMNEVCLAMRHADGNLSTNLIIDDKVC